MFAPAMTGAKSAQPFNPSMNITTATMVEEEGSVVEVNHILVHNSGAHGHYNPAER